MLTSLTVENWKSFEKATLHIDALTVLIGMNASGKSNLLEAFAFLNRIMNGASLTAALQGDVGFPAIRGGFEWAPRRPARTFVLDAVFYHEKSVDCVYRIECGVSAIGCELLQENLDRIDFQIDDFGNRLSGSGRRTPLIATGQGGLVPSMHVAFPSEKSLGTILISRQHSSLYQLTLFEQLGQLSPAFDTVVHYLRDVFILDPIPTHMRGYKPLSERFDADGGNIAGIIAGLPDNRRHEVEASLTRYAKQLPERDVIRVYTATVGKFNSDAMLYCEEQFSDTAEIATVDARGLSDGTLRFLAIVTALLTRPAGSLLIIEEVDNGLHPSRSGLLLDMLRDIGRDRNIDVLVTTHNPALLDAAGPSMVPFITVAHRDPKTGASCLTLLEDIAQLPKLLAQGPIGRITSEGSIERALSSHAGQTA